MPTTTNNDDLFSWLIIFAIMMSFGKIDENDPKMVSFNEEVSKIFDGSKGDVDNDPCSESD